MSAWTSPAASSLRSSTTISSITSRQSPTIGHVGPAHLALLGRVDVDVDDLGVGGEGRHLAGDPVVEPGAEGDEQVGLLHRRDRGGVAVHARHAEAQRVRVGEGAAGHQGGDDVDLGQLGQLAQRLGGPRLEDAAAHVEDRAARRPGSAWPPRGPCGDGRAASACSRAGPPSRASTSPCVFCRTSFGHVDQDRTRAAGRGDVEGLADGRGRSWALITSSLCLVTERVMPTVSHSWKASVPIAAVAPGR